jgi:hypothetical protein
VIQRKSPIDLGLEAQDGRDETKSRFMIGPDTTKQKNLMLAVGFMEAPQETSENI